MGTVAPGREYANRPDPSADDAENRKTESAAPDLPTVSPSPSRTERPGALRGASVMTVKTHLAQQLVFGRAASQDPNGKRAIIGLIGFAGMLKPIFAGAKLDDPYADKWLLDIEAAIDATACELAELEAEVTAALAKRSDVQHTIAQSVKPQEVPLYFSNQLAFRAAYLINDFDTLVCAIQTGRHVAVLTASRSNALIQRASKAIRRTFTSAGGYRYTGVSRADIAHGTAKAAEALNRWGELPVAILSGAHRAEYGPPLPADSYAPRIAADADAKGECATVLE